MGHNFKGAVGLDCGWQSIASYLLQAVDAWEDLDKRSPKGVHWQIVRGKTATFFVTVANRAILNDRIFVARELSELAAETVAETYGYKHGELSEAAQDRLRRAEYKSITDGMKALVHFQLFKAGKRGRYYITDLGKTCYEYLHNDNDDTYDFRDIALLDGSGAGQPPRRSDPEIRV